jgi:hypothetical protein
MSTHRHELTPDAVAALTVNTEPFLSCDDCFHLVDRFVETVLRDPGARLPAMRAHLAGCPACSEEAESLLRLLAEDAGIDPEPALRGLHGN